VALTGTAGIGKTALAVHWAHRVAGTFTDGQLYVDLRGYAATPPLRPVEALSAVLRALGVSPQRVPVDLDEAVGLYRTLLARTRMLVVLDNAVSCDQVRPLLPGSPTCYVLVTSRDRLSGLIARDGACRVVLDGLPPEAALTLLARIIGADRADAAALAELARLCAYLPLALRAAAANLVNQPHRTVAGYAAELAQQGNRLAALEVDGDKHAAVRAAFDLSYRALSPPLRRMLRHLGLNPGPDFTASSAAALANTTASHAGQLLDQLAAVHLIIPEPAGRYRLHDLLRIYAAQQAESRGGERRAALERLTAWYLGTAGAAAALLYPHLLRLDASAGAVCFDHAGASAWLDTERPNLVAVIQHAAEHGPRPAAWLLADALRGYFALRRHMVDWLTTAKAALAAACHEGETRAECSARLSLGHAYWSLGRYPEAKEQYTGALACAAEACWPEGSATNLGNLGLIYWEMGELEAAADHLASALALDRQTGRRAGEANNQANLGYVLRELGRLDEAADHCAQALSLYRALGAKAGEANALNNLGHVQHDLGRFADALDLLGQALTLYREVGDRSNEADTCAAAAAVHRDAGHYAQAISLAQTALDLARQIGDRRTETDALNALGRAYQRTGCHRQALGLHELALNLARVTGTRYQEAEALLGLSLAHAQADRPDRARSCAAKAAAIARQAPYRRLAELSSAGSDGDGKRTAP
jgi:tetratricopeptide (TPR) repeat protein